MKQAVSLAAAVAVVIVMVGLLFWQRNREPEYEYVPVAPPQFVRIVERAMDEVTKVVFYDHGESLTMVPVTDEYDRVEWTVEGADFLFNSGATSDKVRAAATLFSMQVVYEDMGEVPDLRLEDFGFGNIVMTAHYADGTTMNLLVGHATADFSGHFAMVEGEMGLYIISMANTERLRLGVAEMLDFALPVWDATTIEYFFVHEQGREPIEFEREYHHDFEELRWVVMRTPLAGREVWTDSFNHHVLEHFESFMFWDMANIYPDDLAAYGLDAPRLEMIYRAPHGEAHLLFGDVSTREMDDTTVSFIYVKFADRPHVFEALYEHARVLFNMNPLRFVARFTALVNIVDVERIDFITPGETFEIYINQEEESATIAPTINGILVEERPFRQVYQLLIGLGIDSEVEAFTPTGEPIYSVTYTLHEDDDLVLRFFDFDANFLATQVNDDDVWFVTSRRNFDAFINGLMGLLEG